jgi:hypothetical protein
LLVSNRLCRRHADLILQTRLPHLLLLNTKPPRHRHITLIANIYVNKMAGPKYQDIPQRDSLDEPQYSQAPPSYDAEASTQAALLSGVPRSEDDNLPDDFKFGGVVAEATLDIRMAFIRKVYSIL